MNYKVCTKCDKKLEATSKNFHRVINGKFGFTSKCKVCTSIHKKQYRKKSCVKVRMSEYNKQYYEKNKKKLNARSRKYYKNNKERLDECARLLKNK